MDRMLLRQEGFRRSPVLPRHARLAVVIVNFCQWRNTARLVRQLRHANCVREQQAGVVLVDNGSPDHSLANKLEKLRGVRLLRNRRNLGFAKAVNRGGVAASSDWILLLNPDITVEDGFLDRVLALLDELPQDRRVGVVGLHLKNADGSPQPSAGPFPTLLRTLVGLLRRRDCRKCRPQSTVERDPVDWVTGGCLLIRRECFRDLGGLDERYFLYYEDVDFCRRAHHHGWQVLYDPRVAATHHWPLHRRAVPAPLRLITRHALLTYARQHWSSYASMALATVVSAEAWTRRMLARFRGKSETAATYRELSRLVADMQRDNRPAVARSIEQAARSFSALAAMQDDSHAD